MSLGFRERCRVLNRHQAIYGYAVFPTALFFYVPLKLYFLWWLLFVHFC